MLHHVLVSKTYDTPGVKVPFNFSVPSPMLPKSENDDEPSSAILAK